METALNIKGGIETPDYGIDAPNVIRNFILLGIAMMITGGFLQWLHQFGAIVSFFSPMLVFWGASWIITSLLMVLYAKRGKFKHRDRILAMHAWRGDEIVLDIGTGRGLLAIGAAKRLRTGKAIGIDIWNEEDLSGNKQENTITNIAAEGVQEKVALRTEDVRKMSFADNTFDVILSNLCIHNLYQKEQRDQACREIARVLKPGGVALISDFRHTAQYAKALKGLGLSTERLGPYWKSTFPALSVIKAQKSYQP